jgi:hypothetical protein
VGIGFTTCSGTCTDNSDPIDADVGVSDEQEVLLSRHSDRDEPALTFRMVRIIERLSERVQVDGLGLIE